MDYNNILKNKKKFKDIKNKTFGIINKATDKLTEVTSTAVDTVVGTVKNIGNQQAKVSVFENVISVIDAELIDATMKETGAKISIVEYNVDYEGVISIEGVLQGLTEDCDEKLKTILTSPEYIEPIFALVGAHYKYESDIKYDMDKRVITISVISETKVETESKVEREAEVETETETEKEIETTTDSNEKEDVAVTEEHICDCEPVCENCTCKDETIKIETLSDEK